MQWRGLLGLWLQVFLEYTATDAFTYSSTPSGIEGIRPDGGRWLGLQSAVRSISDAVPVQSQSTDLPATTEGRWRRRHLSPGHKAGPLAVF